MASDDLKNKLIGYIEDAYAMENEIAEVLEKQVQVTQDVPVINQKLKQHLAETQLQRRRMQHRLEAYGKQPSAIKGAVSNVMGNIVGLAGGMRNDTYSRLMRDDYTTEHMEIAAYTLLITTAELVGDHETVKAAQESLREEIAMAEWCAQHLPESFLLDLKDQGLSAPAGATHTGPKLTVTFEPSVGQTTK